MEQVSMDEVQELWNDLSEQSWAGFRQALENKRNKPEGMENSMIDQMVQMATDIENSGEPFPQNPDELYRTINTDQG